MQGRKEEFNLLMAKGQSMRKNGRFCLLMTGGHAGGFASAVVDEVRAKQLNWRLHWVGPKYSVEGKKALSIEAKSLPDKGVIFHHIIAGKLQKKFTRYTIPALLRSPLGFVHALVLVKKINPTVVLSFGGYASFPVVIVAWLARIPVIVHEQITGLGLANRLAAPFATKVALARKEGLSLVKRNKAEVIGNPIRKSIFRVKPKARPGNPATLFVFTGSRGSQAVNAALESILAQLLERYTVHHLTGDFDFDRFKRIKAGLSAEISANYHIYDFINPDEVYKFYDKADVIVSRAGANTISELLIVKRPAIVIPFPYIHYDEQTKNAKYAESFGIARVVNQGQLSGAKLLSEIEWLLANWGKVVEAVKDKKSPDALAAKKLVEMVIEVAS